MITEKLHLMAVALIVGHVCGFAEDLGPKEQALSAFKAADYRRTAGADVSGDFLSEGVGSWLGIRISFCRRSG